MMPRLDIGEDEARRIASAITAERPQDDQDDQDDVAPFVPDPAHVAEGRRLFSERACTTCHVSPDAPLAPRGATDVYPREAGRALAPDLRGTRERMEPSTLVAWLDSPAAWDPDTVMPDVLDREEVERVASYLLLTERTPPEPQEPFRRLPLLTREVRYDEVASRVLRDTCWHCHADAAFAFGDGGPGNTGGFGFAPRGVDLARYESTLAGRINDAGERESIVRREEGREPRLLSVLLARHEEVRGAPRPDVRGMPLGLPPLSAEQVQLVESWIAQGRRR